MAEPNGPREISEDVVPGEGTDGVVEYVTPQRSPVYRTRRYVPASHLEWTRLWLAVGILTVALLTTAWTIVAHVAGAMDTPTFTSTMSGLSGLQALAAAVVGFYFGANKSD